MAAGDAFDAKRDAIENGNFTRVGEQPIEDALHVEGDGQTVWRKRVARRKGVFDLHGRVAVDENFTGEMERGAFAVERVLREAVENGKPDEERRELGMIDHFEVELFFGAADGESQIDRNHGRRSAELAGDGGEMVAGNGADGAADVDDFSGSELGGKRGDDLGCGPWGIARRRGSGRDGRRDRPGWRGRR